MKHQTKIEDAAATPASAARQGFSPLFVALTVLFCICLIVSNLMEIKTLASFTR